MPQLTQVFKTLKQIKNTHLAALPTIKYKNRTYEFYFLKDILRLYKKLTGEELSTDWFLKNCVVKESPFIVCHILRPYSATGYSILYDCDLPKSYFETAKKITGRILTGFKRKEPVPCKTGNTYEVGDSESEELVIPPQIKQTSKFQLFDSSSEQEPGNDNISDIRNISNAINLSGDSSNSSLVINPDRFTPAKTQQNNTNSQFGTTVQFCEFSDSEECVPATFKSPLETKQKKQALPRDVKANILASFSNYPVLSMETFQTAYCQTNGMMFDFRKERCPIPHHPHGNLSKFLKCFTEILSFRQFRKLYILNISEQSKAQANARFNAYLKKPNDFLYEPASEALLCSVLGCVTTLAVEDFADLFAEVYKNTVDVLGTPLLDFLFKLKSPNLTVVKKEDVYNISVVPLHSPDFVESYGREKHSKIFEIEERIIKGQRFAVKEAEKSTEHPLVVPLSLQEKVLPELLAQALNNVPRCVQQKMPAGLDIPYGQEWLFLNANLLFQERRTFFN